MSDIDSFLIHHESAARFSATLKKTRFITDSRRLPKELKKVAFLRKQLLAKGTLVIGSPRRRDDIKKKKGARVAPRKFKAHPEPLTSSSDEEDEDEEAQESRIEESNVWSERSFNELSPVKKRDEIYTHFVKPPFQWPPQSSEDGSNVSLNFAGSSRSCTIRGDVDDVLSLMKRTNTSKNINLRLNSNSDGEVSSHTEKQKQRKKKDSKDTARMQEEKSSFKPGSAPSTNRHPKNNETQLMTKESLNVVSAEQALKNIVSVASTSITFQRDNIIEKKLKSPSTASSSARLPKDLDKQFRRLIQTSIQEIGEIRKAMQRGFDPPDGIDEWERLKRRTAEFTARYSRNYGYQITRQMQVLHKVTHNLKKLSDPKLVEVQHCLFVTHQLICNSLHAYRTGMTSLLASDLLEKLIDILEQSIVLGQVHGKCLNHDEFGGSTERENLLEDLKRACDDFLVDVQDVAKSTRRLSRMIPVDEDRRALACIINGKPGQYQQQPFPRQRALSLLPPPPSPPQQQRSRPLKRAKSSVKTFKDASKSSIAVSKRLSMYAVPAKLKKKLGLQRIDKFANIKPRYLEAQFKHRPPPSEKLPPVQPLRFLKSAPTMRPVKNTPHFAHTDEDDIQTMMGGMVRALGSSAISEEDDEEMALRNSTRMVAEENSCRPKSAVTQTTVTQNAITQCAITQSAITQSAITQSAVAQIPDDLILRMYELYNQENSKFMTHEQFESSLKNLLEKSLLGVESGSNKRTMGGDSAMRPKSAQIQCHHESTATMIPGGGGKGGGASGGVGTHQNRHVANSHLEPSKGKAGIKYSEEVSPVIGRANIGNKSTANAETNRNKQTITYTTNAKNAQLICIKDERSIDQDISNNNGGGSTLAKSSIAKPRRGRLPPPSKTIASNSGKNTAIKPYAAKIARLPSRNDLKPLTMIPATELMPVINYKVTYSNYSRKNTMYAKSKLVKPWVIIDSLSDQLMDDMLLSIVKEIHVEDTLRGLFESEFQ